jgi:hypothetical protein
MRALRWVLIAAAALFLVVFLMASVGLVRAHWAIASEGDALPSAAALSALLASSGDLPVQLTRVNTSSQALGDGGLMSQAHEQAIRASCRSVTYTAKTA